MVPEVAVMVEASADLGAEELVTAPEVTEAMATRAE